MVKETKTRKTRRSRNALELDILENQAAFARRDTAVAEFEIKQLADFKGSNHDPDSDNVTDRMMESFGSSQFVGPDEFLLKQDIFSIVDLGTGAAIEDRLGGSNPEFLRRLRIIARRLYRFEAIAHSVIEAFVMFIWGTGPTVTPNDDNPEHLTAWKKFITSQNWLAFGIMLIRNLFRDGEVFIFDRKDATNDPKPRFRLLAPEKINPKKNQTQTQFTHGIETKTGRIEDVTVPINYFFDDEDGPISAERIIHVKINSESTEKRGRSILESVIEDIRDYRKFRKNRAKLNWVRTLVAVVKQVGNNATQSQVQSISNNALPEQETDSKGRVFGRQLAPGAILTTNFPGGWTMLAPNLQAGDARHDGRMILLSIAASTGLSEVWLTADSQNANFASQSVAEAPAIRNMQVWQTFIAEQVVAPIYERVIQAAIVARDIKPRFEQITFVDGVETKETQDADLTASITWPGLIHRDFGKEAKGSRDLIEALVSDARTEATRHGLDFDQVLENRTQDIGGRTQAPEPQKTADEKRAEDQTAAEAYCRSGRQLITLGETLTEGFEALEKSNGNGSH